jgi:hypothetical protein
MPMEYNIDRTARLVRIVGSGRLTDREMVECVSRLRADPMLEPDMNTLADMRGIEVGFSQEGVTRMLEVMEATADRRTAAKGAIVVSSDAAFGMSRMIEMRSEERTHPTLRVFRDMHAACNWLGIG